MDFQPLAYRMRPKHIDEVVGQKHIISKNSNLYKMILKNKVPSMLLYGEPGIGKTSIGHAIAGTVNRPFLHLNATTSGKKDIEYAVQEARVSKNVILFIDEIHRFNKLQQDYLLPYVEDGSITLIGATTSNPFHDVNPAIRSRCGQILQLRPLTEVDIKELLLNAINDKEKGYGKYNIKITDDQLEKIILSSYGDARKSLNMLETVVNSADEKDGVFIITDTSVDYLLESNGVFGDKKGTHFYNLLSALQKSIRGSDVNASLYYLANLLETGNLPDVNRRLLVIAYEDIGLANTIVGTNVLSAVTASERLGLPEARIPLSVAVVEMCLSSKSNSAYQSLDRALNDIREGNIGEIPMHLRDAHYKGAAVLGHVGYNYPHDNPLGSFGGWVNQEYLPSKLKDRKYYQPKQAGEELRLAAIYEKLENFKKNN